MLLNNNSLCEALPGFSYYICRNVLAAIENTSMLDRYLRILAYILARSAAVLPPRRSQHCAGNLQGEFTSSFGKLGASSSFRSLRHKIGSRFFLAGDEGYRLKPPPLACQKNTSCFSVFAALRRTPECFAKAKLIRGFKPHSRTIEISSDLKA